MRTTIFALLIVAIAASPADAKGSHKHHGPPHHGGNKGSEQMHAALHKAIEALKAEGKTIDEQVKKGVFEAFCAAHKDEPGCAKGKHHGMRHGKRHGGKKGLRGANDEHGPQRDPSQGKAVEGQVEMSAALGAAERDGMDASDEEGEGGDEAEDEGEDEGEGGRRGPPVGGILAGVCALAGVVGAAVVARKRVRSRNAATAPANLTPVPMQTSNQVALVPQGKGGDYHDML